MKLIKTFLKNTKAKGINLTASSLGWTYPFFIIFAISSARATEIGQSLNRLNSDTQKNLVLPLSIMGFIVAGLYYVFGKQEASQRFAQVLMGVVVALSGAAIVGFIKGAM